MSVMRKFPTLLFVVLLMPAVAGNLSVYTHSDSVWQGKYPADWMEVSQKNVDATVEEAGGFAKQPPSYTIHRQY